VPAATDTPVPAATDTPVPAATDTPVPAATDTPTPLIPAHLPNTGGDPPQRDDFLLTVVLAAWVVGTLAFSLSVRARRRER
ncbi:MAG: hypothetical protein ABI901_06390, partial [Roseiflexaceae bacterium]